MSVNLQLKSIHNKLFQFYIVIAVVILSGIAGYFIGKNSSPSIQLEKISQLNKQASNDINFLFINDGNLNYIESNEAIPFLEKKLSNNEITVHINSILYSNKKNKKMNKGPAYSPTAGLLNLGKINLMEKNGMTIFPILAASPELNTKCFSEVQILTLESSNIKNIKDLEQKKLAINNIGFSITAALIEKNQINLHRAINYTEFAKSLPYLEKGSIDAIALNIQVLETGKIISPLGEFANGKYAKKSNFKVIATSNFQIPCKIIFAREEIGERQRGLLMNSFLSLLKQKDDLELLNKSFGVQHLYSISIPEWKKSKAYFEKNYNLKIRTFNR